MFSNPYLTNFGQNIQFWTFFLQKMANNIMQKRETYVKFQQST